MFRNYNKFQNRNVKPVIIKKASYLVYPNLSSNFNKGIRNVQWTRDSDYRNAKQSIYSSVT